MIFQETVNGEIKTYCDLLCPGADTAYRCSDRKL